RLLQHSEQPLAHLSEPGIDAHGAVVAYFEHCSAVFGHAVADANVLDSASYTCVLRALVDVLYGFECFFQSYARFELLAGTEYVANIQRVSITHLPSVYPNLLGEDVNHRVHRKSRLI